jgi:tetratricopeptide (TPR) repeat protein
MLAMSAGMPAFAQKNPNCFNPTLPPMDVIVACNENIASDSRDAQVYQARGLAWYRIGDYDRAIADLTQAISIDPKYIRAFYNRGLALEKKGKLDDALTDLKYFAGLDPSFPDAQKAIARVSETKKKVATAAVKFPEVTPSTAADDAMICYRETGDVAISACTRAINSGSSRPSINYLNRANAYRDNGDTDRAVADYTETIRLNPKYALAYNGRGNAYLNKGDTDSAIADYTEAIRLDPKSAYPYNGRGNAYHDKGEADRAIANYNEAIRLDPKYALAYNGRGNAYRNKGELDHAVADYNEALRLDPKFAHPYNGRANVYRDKGETDRAIADFTEAIRLDPKFLFAYNNRGIIYRDKGDTDRAIADFNEAIRLNPKIAGLYVNRGLVYEKIADVSRARADFNTALGLAQKGDKWPQDKARERLAAMPPLSATVTSKESNVVTDNIAPAAPVLNTDHRVALVIGNSAYENVAALPNPERDANLVADVLKRTGFESVTLLTNLRKDALVGALRNFAAHAETADWAIVYYAGHGMEVGGINYLIPTDAKIAADRDIGFEAVPLEQALNAAERAKKLRLVILDACRDNPFANQMKRTLTVASRSVSRGLAAVEPEAGTLVVYAAKDGETALDGDGSNSPFAAAFVKNLPTPGLEVRRLFDFVRDDVMEATNRKQKPFSYGSISGRQDLYFVAGK